MIYSLEKWMKEKAFGCQMCGQCILSHTRLICPMNCPKGLRNGPCGGTLDGKCEVVPEMDCVWTRIEVKKDQGKKFTVHQPLNRSLVDTASYVNFFTGKDRPTRLPKEPRNTLHIPADSDLSRKMHRQEFVVTLEIASPRKTEGLKKVAAIMERVAGRVDAVNTTTNAGGKPSLHSTETGKVVMEHGVESVIQFCGRDHTPDDFLREMEQAIEMGYKNFLLLTGDWLPDVERKTDQQTWFPMDSSQMVFAINERLESFRERSEIVPYIGVAANPFSTPLNVSVERLALKRLAGARFCQTQAVTDVGVFRTWYQAVRQGREHEAKLTIPSIPLIGNRRAFDILCRLPGVYVSPELHAAVEQAEDLPRAGYEWALKTAEGVVAAGAAGVHVMNFGMPPEWIEEYLVAVRERAIDTRAATTSN